MVNETLGAFILVDANGLQQGNVNPSISLGSLQYSLGVRTCSNSARCSACR